jgi:F0F1-type ATP synthase delta subunit
MNERIYSEALHQAVLTGTRIDVALRHLKEILKRNGHSALYAKVLKAAEAKFAKDERTGTLEIVLARTSDEKAYKEEIAAVKKSADAAHTTIRLDETIVGGYIARSATKEVDASFKRSLLAIYRSLIA